MNKKIKIGTELLVDGCRWVNVTDITEDGFMVCDQDGDEFEITMARVTEIY
jgi:hypothetical protein